MSTKAKEMSKCSCGGKFSWHWKNKKGAEKGFSSSVVVCDRCGKKMSAEDAHEFTKEVLKQI